MKLGPGSCNMLSAVIQSKSEVTSLKANIRELHILVDNSL